MAKVLQFSTKTPTKFGFERVKKRKRKTDPEQEDQLNLFAATIGRILHLPREVGLFEEALMLDEQGDSRAAELYWKAIGHGDCVAHAYCNLGILESQQGRTVKAFDCFTKALQYDPRHFETHYNLGNLYFEIGDFHVAHMHYRIASEVDPDFPNVYFNLGLLHAMNKNFKEAVECLTKYKELTSPDEGVKADQLLTSLKRSLTTRR